MKRLFLSLAVTAIMACSCVGCVFGGGGSPDNNDQNNNNNGTNMDPVVKVTNETYGSFWMRCHDYLTMPVTAYNALAPEAVSGNATIYADYKEAGVNTLMALYEGAPTKASLDLCEENGLAYLVQNPNTTNEAMIRGQLAHALYHNAFAGVMLSDEPGYTSFESLKTSADVLDSVMPEDTTGSLWHVNLFPTYAKNWQLYYRSPKQDLPEGMDDYPYEQYVSDFLRVCKPKVLSYDFYPCRKDEGTLLDGYFQNMAIVRSAALGANIPFWVYIQTCSFNNNTRIPNKADILWQVNTALSYGAKGIQYFTGVVARNAGGEKFDGAMFDLSGNRTAVYEYVKAANKQIAAVDEVLMCSKSKGVVVCGTSPWEDCGIPEADQLTTYGELASAEAGHSLVGCFDFNGKTALYVTDNSVTEGDTVALNFTSSVKGYTVVKGVKTAFEGETLTLAPEAGEGILVVIE